MKRTINLFLGLAVVLVCQRALGDEPPDAGADEQSIRETVKQYVQAFNAGDAEAVAGL